MNRIRNGILHATFAVGLLAAVAPVSAEEDRWSSFLPYKKELAGDTELPLPLGVGVIYYEQKQDMQVTDQSFGFDLRPILAGLDPVQIQALGPALQGALGQVRPSDVRNEIRHQNIHLDAWLLPFFNLYAFAGKVRGETTVGTIEIAGVDVGPFEVDYDGPVYGLGFILAGEYKGFWGNLDINYSHTDLDGRNGLQLNDSDVVVFNYSPRVGINRKIAGVKASMWIGGTYMDLKETVKGSVAFPAARVAGVLSNPQVVGRFTPDQQRQLAGVGSLPASFNVETEPEEAWSGLFGFEVELYRNWRLLLEHSFGHRDHLLGQVSYRF
ncbi:MAG: hypothetical protein OXU54_00815 [Gammaproteobacteria bacterium]|nr:hypothetical protein [Gammaproteobacteria bacterium]